MAQNSGGGKLWRIKCHSPIFYPTKFISIFCKGCGYCSEPDALIQSYCSGIKLKKIFKKITKIKRWHWWESNPHIHTHKAVMLPTGSLELRTVPFSFKTFKYGLGLIYGPTHDLRTGPNGPRILRTISFSWPQTMKWSKAIDLLDIL